ncbi:hypothetical protein U0070_006150 [Myodes glareolus]|uniref:Uncharacterized protein n=1 Tax=Myodes glareolus TaxID=447135 RepID=A0AAW0I3V9_MYOGA
MLNLAALLWRRLLRKRWVLALVFGLSLVYFLSSTFKQDFLGLDIGSTWLHVCEVGPKAGRCSSVSSSDPVAILLLRRVSFAGLECDQELDL